MKLPAYGKKLLALREAGERPWCVVVAVGAISDPLTLKGQAGVARVGLPLDYPFDSGDLGLLQGLDLLLSCFAARAGADGRVLLRRALAAIDARAEPGLLWCVTQSGTHAAPLERIGAEFVLGSPRVALDQDFRLSFGWWHRAALLAGDRVFARPEFDRARERMRCQLTPGHAAA